jgi:hypothetical protein
MKRIEISYRSAVAEMAKLQKKLDRAEKALAKKKAVADKYGVTEWSKAEHRAWLETVPANNGFILNQEDVDKNGAWFDLRCAEDDLLEVKEAISRVESKLSKAEQEVDQYHKEIEKIADLKQKELLWQMEFEEEQKEWAKDGIILENRYYGTTPAGKSFVIYDNNGITERSRHCFSLRIAGETIFTSGEFWRAYAEIKSR